MGKRLKKGSAAAKAWGRKMARLRNPSRKSKRSSSVIKSKRTRTMPKKKKRRSVKRGLLGGTRVIAPMLYGGLRQRMSNFLRRWTSQIPLGNVSDEVGMLAALWASKKFLLKKAGVLRDTASHGMSIEFARLGEAIAQGQLGGIFNANGNAGGGLPVV